MNPSDSRYGLRLPSLVPRPAHGKRTPSGLPKRCFPVLRMCTDNSPCRTLANQKKNSRLRHTVKSLSLISYIGQTKKAICMSTL